jgi:hypothetical protein
MRIGLDIATFCQNRAVDRIVLVSADTDCVPAMKHGRKAGLQIVIVQLQQQRLAAELLSHADFCRTVEFPQPQMVAAPETHDDVGALPAAPPTPETSAHQPFRILRDAIAAYDYPAVTFDFANQRPAQFPTVRDLDEYLNRLLHSENPADVKDALAGILYWGFLRVGYRDYRVQQFCTTVTDQQLQRCIQVFRTLQGAALRTLKDLRLPEFGFLPFLSKLRTFLDPQRYCVLDNKIGKLQPLRRKLKIHDAIIPVSHDNEAAYGWWVQTCQDLAAKLNAELNAHPPLRPVDIERGIFHLVQANQQDEAEHILAQYGI